MHFNSFFFFPPFISQFRVSGSLVVLQYIIYYSMKNTAHTNLTVFCLLLQKCYGSSKVITDLLYHLLAQDQHFHMTYITSTSLSQTCIFAAR